MSHIPDRIRVEMHKLIQEGLPTSEIAFMMRVDESVVESEIERLNTTKRAVASK